jgi:hypothetical protein
LNQSIQLIIMVTNHENFLGIDTHVDNKLKTSDISWIPLGRAMALE